MLILYESSFVRVSNLENLWNRSPDMTSLRHTSRKLDYECSKGLCKIGPRYLDQTWWPTFTHLPTKGSIQCKCHVNALNYALFADFSIFNFQALTKLPSFNINIIDANRSIKGTLTFHLTWPHYITNHMTLIIGDQNAHAKFDPVTLMWPSDPLLHNFLAVYST